MKAKPCGPVATTAPRFVRSALFSLAVGVGSSFLGAPAFAADPAVEADLAAAEAAYGQLNYEDAAKRAEIVTKKRGLSHDQLVRSYRVLAFSRSAIGDEEHARESFVLLLAFDPDHKVDKNLGPKVQQPFLEAKGYWRQQMARPGVEAQVGSLRQGTTSTLHVVTRDPSRIVKTVTVGYRFGANGKFETSNVAVGDQAVNVAIPQGETRLDYFAQALDANDSVVFEVGSPNAPKTALVEVKSVVVGPRGSERGESSGSIFSSPLFWVATGVVLAGGAVGTYFLATAKNTREEALPPTGSALSPIVFCGIERCR